MSNREFKNIEALKKATTIQHIEAALRDQDKRGNLNIHVPHTHADIAAKIHEVRPIPGENKASAIGDLLNQCYQRGDITIHHITPRDLAGNIVSYIRSINQAVPAR